VSDSSRDSIRNTLLVAVGVSFVCSILVAATAVALKPVQQRNEDEYRQRIILEVAGLMQPDVSIETLFAAIETRMIEIDSGDYVSELAASDTELNVAIPAELDIANIRQRAVYSPVYLVKEEGAVQQIILPVYGSGLWSTMYGYLSVATDGSTVNGLRFYSHAETPGLGDQIDKPEWRAQWVGKQLYDESGAVRIEVIRGIAQDRNSRYEIDGLSGATLTGRGVTQLVRFWTGPQGFGPYLQKIQSLEGDAS
jgi:Na+-transporting NADH:ubiquinone oxidoreductase subunit C